MLKGMYLADMPIIIAAIDPCFSCTDRTISVGRSDASARDIIHWPHLQKYSVDWYRRRGIDFSQLNKKLLKDLK
jgi:NADH-quinone oxidoreductase subunit D